MSIRIVTDSSCDLPEALARDLGITVVPLVINMGSRSYRDGIDISRKEFYERLPGSKTFPTTSAPSPGQFMQVYEKLAAEGADDVISIHISPTLSAVLNSARLAAEEVISPRVTLVDSRQLSMGVGYVVLAAADMVRQGATVNEVVAALDDIIPRVHVFALLDTVEFLRRSGRLNVLQFGVANLFHIRPLLRMNDGKALSERIRTSKAGKERLLELLHKASPLESLTLVHTNAPERAEALFEEARPNLGSTFSPECVEVTPVIGAHIGPGAFGFACVSARRESTLATTRTEA